MPSPSLQERWRRQRSPPGNNLYLHENLDKPVPIAQTFDAKSNLAAQDRMKQLATSRRLIIPGHVPEVFVRFPKPGNGEARLE